MANCAILHLTMQWPSSLRGSGQLKEAESTEEGSWVTTFMMGAGGVPPLGHNELKMHKLVHAACRYSSQQEPTLPQCREEGPQQLPPGGQPPQGWRPQSFMK